MPHISNKKISDENYEKIYNQLRSIFDTAGANRKSDALLQEFLTETEKTMLAKRLAILYMIDEGISKHYISQILSVSSSTVDRISMKYEVNKYPYIKAIIKRNKRTIWEIMEGVISNSVKHKLGKGRYDWFDEINRKYDRKIYKS